MTRSRPDPGYLDAVRRSLATAGARPLRWHLQHHEGEPIAEVASRLGIRPIELVHLARQDAASQDWMDWFATDMLVRLLREHFPGGWGCARPGFSLEFTRASFAVEWIVRTLGEDYDDSRYRAVLEYLDAHASSAWRPASNDDKLVSQAMEAMHECAIVPGNGK